MQQISIKIFVIGWRQEIKVNRPVGWKERGRKKLEEVEGNICENKGKCSYKTMGKDNMSQRKNQYSFPKTIQYAKPNRIWLLIKGVYMLESSKGRISKPRGYLHRCIRSLSLTKYNNATRNASQLLNSIQTLNPCVLFPRDDVDQTPTSPLDRYSWD